MAGLYGISAYQQTSQAYSKSTVNNDTKTQSTAKSDQTAATKGSQAKVETKGWSPIDTKSSLVPTKTEYGMTIGDVQLSDKAKDYLGKLQSKFHGMEFITVSKDMKAQVQQNLGVAVLKEAMDSSGQGLETMLSSMTESLDPNLGTMIDVLA